MNKRKKGNRIVVIFIFIIFFLNVLLSCVNSETIEEIHEYRKKIEEQISENSFKLEELNTEISGLMQEINTYSNTMYEYEVSSQVLTDEINLLSEQVRKVTSRLELATAEFEKQKKIIERRVVTQYEEGDTAFLEVLLNSKSIVDFISNYYICQEILEYDKQLLVEYEKQKTIIETSKKTLDEANAVLLADKEELIGKQNMLEHMKLIKNIKLESLNDEEYLIQNSIDTYNSEMAKTESEILILLTQNMSTDYVGGALMWPVPRYYTVTSPFGMRVHPIAHVEKLHTGLDVAAPTGSTFVAANDGVVLKAAYSGSYGNMVLIDHGGGMATLYAHGSEILVAVGDEVKKGNPVLKVGSTGYSTGPHAHFEVRVNGISVNPIEYLTSK
jgi:murein DD-endopeptidase MepM/ murein hydrolase activator NlpD